MSGPPTDMIVLLSQMLSMKATDVRLNDMT